MNYQNLFKTGIIVLALCLSTGITSYAGSNNGGSNQSSNNANPRSWWWELWYRWHQHQNNNNNSQDDNGNTNGNWNDNNNHDDDDDNGNSNGNWNDNNNHDDDDDNGNTNGNWNDNNNHDDDDDNGNTNGNWNDNNNHDDDDYNGNTNGNWNDNNNHDDDDDNGNTNGNWNNNNNHDDDDDGCTAEVTEFTVVKKGTGGSIGTMYEGIRLNDDCDLNIEAHVGCESEIGSVEFILNGNTHRIENNDPYALAGNSGSSFNDMNLPVGSYHLKAIPWSGANATGTAGVALEINFTVEDAVGNRNSDCILKSYNDNNNNNNTHDDDDDSGNTNGNWNDNNNHDDDDDNGNTNGNWNDNNNHDDDDDNGNTNGNWNDNNNHDDDDDNGNTNGNWNDNNNHDDDDDNGNTNGNWNDNNNHDDDDDNGNSNNNNHGCDDGGAVSGLALVRGGTSDEIATLYDGYSFDRDCGVNIRAHVDCYDEIRSVVFILNGNVTQVENSAPYTLGGDLSGVYKAIPQADLPVGSHHLKVVPYSGSNGSGTAGEAYELWFNVVDEDCHQNGNNNNNHDDDDDNGNWNDNNNHDDDDDNGNWNDNNNNSNFKTTGSSGVNEGDVIRVFPNPTAGEFEIRLSLAEAGDITVRLFDVSGKLIVDDSKLGYTGVYNKKIDLRQQAVGIYFLSLNVNGKITTEKILYSH